LLASAPDPATGKPDPAKMSAFLTKHPESAKAMQLIRSQPVSSGFADSTYNSLNAFRFINAQGVVVRRFAGRWCRSNRSSRFSHGKSRAVRRITSYSMR
jgi:hypothetical protein